MDLAQLKKEIIDNEPREFVEKHILNGVSTIVTDEHIQLIVSSISNSTGITIQPEEVKVVGSAKLGYGLFEKKRRDLAPLPAFRPFSVESDIDIAFVSPSLFDTIWAELNTYAINKPYMPYRMNKLGDYLVYGWIRPDHVPKDARLMIYDMWRDTIRRLSTSGNFGLRKVSGALYRDIEFLTKYQTRAIADRKKFLELT